MKLYEIANEYQQAFDAMTDEGLSSEIVADSLAGIQTSFEEKANAVAAHIQNLEAEANQISEAHKRMMERYSKFRKRIDSLKAYLYKNMKACDIKKLNTPEFEVSIRKNPPKLIIEDETKIPADCKISKIETFIVKNLIKERLNSGEEVPGAHLEQSERLHFE